VNKYHHLDNKILSFYTKLNLRLVTHDEYMYVKVQGIGLRAL